MKRSFVKILIKDLKRGIIIFCLLIVFAVLGVLGPLPIVLWINGKLSDYAFFVYPAAALIAWAVWMWKRIKRRRLSPRAKKKPLRSPTKMRRGWRVND